MKTLTPNMEMYLKTILEIVAEDKRPRVKAIADRLQVRMPSVTGAVETLQGQGMVKHDPYGDVTLTARGKRLAERVIHTWEVCLQQGTADHRLLGAHGCVIRVILAHLRDMPLSHVCRLYLNYATGSRVSLLQGEQPLPLVIHLTMEKMPHG